MAITLSNNTVAENEPAGTVVGTLTGPSSSNTSYQVTQGVNWDSTNSKIIINNFTGVYFDESITSDSTLFYPYMTVLSSPFKLKSTAEAQLLKTIRLPSVGPVDSGSSSQFSHTLFPSSSGHYIDLEIYDRHTNPIRDPRIASQYANSDYKIAYTDRVNPNAQGSNSTFFNEVTLKSNLQNSGDPIINLYPGGRYYIKIVWTFPRGTTNTVTFQRRPIFVYSSTTGSEYTSDIFDLSNPYEAGTLTHSSGAYWSTSAEWSAYNYAWLLGLEKLDAGTFSILPAGSYNDFNIIDNTLVTASSFDYELSATKSITIRHTFSDGTFTDTDFTINVTDVFDNQSPTQIYLDNTSIPENSPINTEIATITADDPENDSMTFSIVGNSSFNISGNKLRSSVVFDYESVTSHLVTIQALDSSGNTFQKTFTISITNLDEAPYNVTLSNNTINENNQIGAIVGVFSSVDTEQGSVSYSLVEGYGDFSSFSITGSNLLASQVFNYEIKSTYSIKVRATDQGSNYTDTVFTIYISNALEAPVNITLTGTSIIENNTINEVIGNLSASDIEGGSLTFSLVSGSDNFNIALNNGVYQLRASTVLNAVDTPTLPVTVQATNSEGLSSTASFTIEVLPYISGDILELSSDQYFTLDNGLVYVETVYNPQQYAILIDGLPVPQGSIVINPNTNQRYLKLPGNSTYYYKIPVNPKPEWKWSEEGNLIWMLL